MNGSPGSVIVDGAIALENVEPLIVTPEGGTVKLEKKIITFVEEVLISLNLFISYKRRTKN